ncbi:MAG: Hsp20 family protein [Micavibrio sp.]|nr:Hsp20 family protein [Micavibrio sp.]
MTTGRLTLFDSPLFLGFDEIEKTFDRMRKSGGEGYPPYNIEQIGDYGYQITLAVAGFSMDDLDVEIENNQLTVRGKQGEDDEERIFLHRGIAARQFQRSFILADGIEVRGAAMDNGLLHIGLERVVPESKAKKIKIQAPTSGKQQASISSIPQAIDVEEEADKSKKPKK